MLKLNNVSFKRGATAVLTGVSLEMNPGEIVALLGPNGAGKTTLMRCILGQLIIDGGSITLGDDTTREGDCSLVSWIPQRVTLFPLLTVEQNLTEFARLMGVPSGQITGRVNEVIALIGLDHRAKDLARSLSGGMQRMLNVGIGLVSDPRILLIDEPTAGIDRAAHERLYAVLDALRDRGLAILLTTHDLDEVSRLACRAMVLVKGQVRAQGSVEQLLEARFADQKEVHVQVAAERTGADEVCAALAGLGLQPTEDGEWQGLAGRQNGQLEQLYQIIDGHESVICDFSFKTPGMELLIQALLQEEEHP